MTDERIIIPTSLDKEEDITIRPMKLLEFIGQKPLLEQLKVLIESSKKRREPLDHILFAGPPGLGKTTLANIIAREMNVDVTTTSGPVLDRAGLVTTLIELKKGDILFIDEIHRLNHVLEEILYPAMEDFYIDYVTGEGNEKRSIKFKIEHFTLIGATTKVGLLSSPFRDRFGFTARLNLYQIDELINVVYRSASILDYPITHDGAKEIARRGRGTPRIVNRLLRRVRDYALVNNTTEINREISNSALRLLGIDKYGLDDLDRRILKVILNDFNGGPVGIKNIAISIGEDVRTIEDVYEPFLIHTGLIKRTSHGREITSKGRKHLGIKNSELLKIDDRHVERKNELKNELTKTNKSGILLVNDQVSQRKYKSYASAIAHMIPLLKENIIKSNDNKIRISAIELAKNMGRNFENIHENTFISGIRYTLFHNNLFLENTGQTHNDQTILVVRERKSDDKLPKYLSDKIIG